jgi:hypothetical protein
VKIPLDAAEPGDLVFCHSTGIIGKGIRFAERFRRDRKDAKEEPGAFWNHVAVLDGCWGKDRSDPAFWTVLEASARGVVVTSMQSAVGRGSFDVVRLPTAANPRSVVKFMRTQTGSHYGFLTLLSILLTLFTPRFVNIMLPGTWICSAVAGEGMRFAGWLKNWPDIYQVSPAQLWIAVQ